MSKIFCLIADDVLKDVDLMFSVIDNSVLAGHYESEVCNCVKTIPPQLKDLRPKIALDFIKARHKSKQPIDFAFLDMQFEFEFGKDTKNDGVNIIISELQALFPLCRIIVLSKRQASMPDTTYNFGNQAYPTISKEASSEFAPEIILKQAEIWTQIKCAEISSDEKTIQSLMVLLASPKFSLDDDLIIKGSKWKINDLFMYHIEQGHITAKSISEKIVNYLFDFPKFENKPKKIEGENGEKIKIDSNRWEVGDKIFKLPLKEYYLELYVFRNKELNEVFNRSMILFEKAMNLILNAILENDIADCYAYLRKERGAINLVAKLEKKEKMG